MSRKKCILMLALCLLCFSGCGRPEPVRESETIVEEKAAVLPDGTTVDIWRPEFGGRDIYKLENGTALLTVEHTVGPANAYVAGRESIDDLNDTARKSIMSFYEEQGRLYDVQSLLEKAYVDYLDCQKSQRSFNGYQTGQDTLPSASNKNMMCFVTTVRIPVSGQETEELRTCALFDRATGEKLNVWDLFAVPEKEAAVKLLALAKIAEEDFPEGLEKAIQPEYMIFLPDHLEITFPRGTLPDQEYSCVVGIDYADLTDILSDQAIPYAEK